MSCSARSLPTNILQTHSQSDTDTDSTSSPFNPLTCRPQLIHCYHQTEENSHLLVLFAHKLIINFFLVIVTVFASNIDDSSVYRNGRCPVLWSIELCVSPRSEWTSKNATFDDFAVCRKIFAFQKLSNLRNKKTNSIYNFANMKFANRRDSKTLKDGKMPKWN
jgi:hypothetical protein